MLKLCNNPKLDKEMRQSQESRETLKESLNKQFVPK